MKRFACLPLLVLAACPPKPQQPATPVTAGVGCPAANDVYLATFLVPDDPGPGTGAPPAPPARGGGPGGVAAIGGGREGVLGFAPSPSPAGKPAVPGPAAPAPTSSGPANPYAPGQPGSAPSAPSASPPAAVAVGWAVPLFSKSVDSFTGVPEYEELTAEAARAAGVPAAPSNLWLLQPGQQPCKASIGPYFAMQVEAPTKNVSYGVKLLGCAPPAQSSEEVDIAAAVVSEQSPSECQLIRPQPVAVRVGQEDAQGHWARPTTQTQIPPGLTAALPSHECRAPDCEMLWAVLQVTVENKPIAWAGAVNWLTIPANAAPETQCSWKNEVFEGMFVADETGHASKIAEGQDPPLGLGGVLADRSGARVLLTGSTGVYSTYDLAAGAAKLARHLVWLILPTEEYMVDARLGPSCEDKDKH